MGPNLREAIPRQYGPFLPINGATSLTRRSERISKWEILGSANEFRAEDRLVNKQLFEPLCLRVFSAFCDLLALSACGTGGAGECRGCTGLVPLKIARRWFRSHAGRLLADRLRSTRPAPDFAALLRSIHR